MGPPVREVVPRRRAQRRLQLRRPTRRARPRQQGRLPLDRRAGRHPHDHLRRPPARGAEGGQRARRARHPDRRPGRDLHADDPRAADRDARLRPDRRAAHGRLRRLLRRGPVRPDQRRPGQARHHRRRWLAPRQARAAQDRRRRGDRAIRRPSRTSWSFAGSGTRRRRDAMEEGRDHWWHDLVEQPVDPARRCPVDSEHMLYLLYTSGTTAKPKGIIHTTAGLSPRHVATPTR